MILEEETSFYLSIEQAHREYLDAELITDRVNAYMGSSMAVRESITPKDLVIKKVEALLLPQKVGCFNRHDIIIGQIDLPEPRTMLHTCPWVQHRSCGHPELNGVFGTIVRGAVLMRGHRDYRGPVDIITAGLDLIARDIRVGNLAVKNLGLGEAGGQEVLDFGISQQTQDDENMVYVLQKIHTALNGN